MEKIITYKLKKAGASFDNVRLDFLLEEYHSNPVSEYTLHTHRYTELFFCGGEAVSIQTEAGCICAPKNSLIVIPEGIKHLKKSGYIDSGSGLMAEKTGDGSLYESISEIIKGKAIVIIKDALSACEYVKKIYNCDGEADRVFYTVAFARELINSEKEKFEVSDERKNTENTELLLKLDSIINSRFSENIRADEIADALFLSKRHLSRIVSKQYGTTLKKLIVAKRLGAAKTLLTTTKMSVESIGSKVGFGTKSCFYTEFERYFGMTPTKYRKKNTAS